jgi:hypothetical protein
MNLTPASLNAAGVEQMIQAGQEFPPSSQGDDSSINRVRALYIASAEPIGSYPLPLLSGADGRAGTARPSDDMLLFMDKLGERLAFERTGTRLYQAFLGKVTAAQGRGAIEPDEVQHFLDEELEHFVILQQAIQRLGGDPTAVTPSANVASVASTGIIQLMTDPRTTVRQSLSALLTAELVDNDCWDVLIKLTEQQGEDDMAREFKQAKREEQEHLDTVRSWITADLMPQAA